MPRAVPFELESAGGGTWRALWVEERVTVFVAGTPGAPHPRLLTTLEELVARWAELEGAIAAFAASWPPDEPVPFDGPMPAHITAAECGFDGELFYQSIAVMDVDNPDRAVILFETGAPDPYICYRVVCRAGVPVSLSSFCT